MNIDFTITAMRRPEVLYWTLESLRQNLRGIDLEQQTVYINIDPAPAQSAAMVTHAIAAGFFRKVFSQNPLTCNFARAVRWCWTQPVTEMFFHLEDDWLLTRPIDIEDLIERLWNGPFCQVALRQYQHAPQYPCLALSHALWKSDAARHIAGRMVDDWNPELQLRSTNQRNPHGNKAIDYSATYFPDAPGDIALIDIGTAWRRAHKVTRPNETTGFNAWNL